MDDLRGKVAAGAVVSTLARAQQTWCQGVNVKGSGRITPLFERKSG